jgi:putative transposase
MTTTIKCRLHPTHEQKEKLEQTLDGCRWIYNYFRKRVMSVEDMQFALIELKESHQWLRNYHSKMLQMVVHQIDAARSALKTLSEHGRKVGKLKYSEGCNTFVYNQSGFRIERHGNTNLLWLSKVGYVEVRLSKQPFNIKQVSITKKPSGRWFANIVCEEARPLIIPRIDTSKCVGIDLGITKFVHDSDNHEKENPLFLRKMLKPLRRADRKLSRRQFGSQNYKKAKHMRARLWERICNKRHDFLHKNYQQSMQKSMTLSF